MGKGLHEDRHVDEKVEAQALVAGSSSIVAPPTTHPVADPNLIRLLQPWQG